MLLLVVFILLPFLGWYVGVTLFDVLTASKYKPNKPAKEDTFVIHNHYDQRQVHFHNTTPPEGNHLQD